MKNSVVVLLIAVTAMSTSVRDDDERRAELIKQAEAGLRKYLTCAKEYKRERCNDFPPGWSAAIESLISVKSNALVELEPLVREVAVVAGTTQFEPVLPMSVCTAALDTCWSLTRPVEWLRGLVEGWVEHPWLSGRAIEVLVRTLDDRDLELGVAVVMASIDDRGVEPAELERRAVLCEATGPFEGNFNTMKAFSPVWAPGRLRVIVDAAMGQEWIDECYDSEKLCSWYSASRDGQPAAAFRYGGYFRAGFGNALNVFWARPLLLEASRVDPAAVVAAIAEAPRLTEVSSLPDRNVAVGERTDEEVGRDWMVEHLCHENTQIMWRERVKK